MHAVDKEVIGQVNTWLQAGQSCWLATVVATWGSSPRPVGSMLTCNQAGALVGSLSGGCVEDDLLEKLTQGQLAADKAQFFEYGLTAEESEKFGLPCGGHLSIVVEPLQPDQQNMQNFNLINQRLTERKSVARRVDLANQQTKVTPVDEHAPFAWDEASQTMTHVYGPRQQLFVIGAGMVSQYLANMAMMLDYEVTICDPRAELLEEFAVPGVNKIADMPDDAIRACADDSNTAIVALTHDPRIDDMGLMEALSTNAFYVGALGSSRTSASRRERLESLDVKPAHLNRLHAPIGLPIGSKTPPEIAVAILAEITAVRKNKVAETQTQLAAASA